MDPDPQWRGKGSSRSSHPMRHNLMSPQDHSETCRAPAQCLTRAPQGVLAAIYHSSKNWKLASYSLCHTAPLLANSADQLPLAFFKACFNCKEQNLVTEENIPFLFIDSQVREQKQLWSWISVSSGATQSWLPSEKRLEENKRATVFPSFFRLQF